VITQAVQPACGPVKGYTQIKITGKNFVEFGFGMAKCLFNGTYYTNATVTSTTVMHCDSPPLVSDNGDMWYNISVTLDGDYISNANWQFLYYDEPVINSVTPWLGPVSGGTAVTIEGTGYNQTNVCDLTVRFGPAQVTGKNVTDTSILVDTPKVLVPGTVVVSVSGNNQQYIDDRTLHYRDVENTFEYY